MLYAAVLQGVNDRRNPRSRFRKPGVLKASRTFRHPEVHMHSRLLLLPALALAVTLASCGSKSSTSPAGGGSGPPTGPTFNLVFTAQGASQSFTFPDAGSWGYHRNPHGSIGMTGTVVVSAAGADSDTVAVGVNGSGGAAFVFTPSTVTIKPGGHVRWINRSTMVNHTVTRP
jgi:plastocyanin